jgi:polysaccharide biosynthesis protein PslA
MDRDLSSIDESSASIGMASHVNRISSRSGSDDGRSTDFYADTYGTSQSGLPVDWHEDGPAGLVLQFNFAAQSAAKRAFDIVFAATALLMFAPLMVLVAIAVRLDGGPALFWQRRVGLNGKPFDIAKFRSTRVGASDRAGVSQAAYTRRTAVGRFIRETSIDELPQLFNILAGDMSFVGPRAHTEGVLAGGQRYDTLVPFYDYRHHVKPGLIGWAQVNGFRSPTREASTARRGIAHDVAYIQNFSLLLDLKCIVRALKNEFIGSPG